MYRMNDGWTDERMDDFRDEVNLRFDGADRRFDEVIKELRHINERLDGMYRTSYLVGGGIIAGLIGVIVTQL